MYRLPLVRPVLCAVVLPLAMSAGAPAAHAQWSTTYEQFYLPGPFNWKFRRYYPAAERLFNAFDYGHAILYEQLWTNPAGARRELEGRQYAFITRKLLDHPPHVALEEAAIEVAYARLAPEAKAMFDWAHVLHRQIYDVWSDESLTDAERDAKVRELITYYKSRPDLAFSSKPKTMALMEGQPYSTAFRRNYPKFNGLIWAYHWLQVGLYEPLVTAKTLDAKQAGVVAAVARFRQMLLDPPNSMPYIMPMTAAIAPTFAARYPEAAIIFDNLHSMHDVVSDILANPNVPRDRKRAEILVAARRYRDDSSYVQTVAEWRDMAQMMGIENMGGPAVGFLPALPRPTVERGAVMAGMEHANMPGMRMGTTPAGAAPMGAMPGMEHGRTHGDSSHAGAAPTMPGMSMPGVAHDSMPPRGASGHGGHTESAPAAGREGHAGTAMPGMRMPAAPGSSAGAARKPAARARTKPSGKRTTAKPSPAKRAPAARKPAPKDSMPGMKMPHP